MKPEDIRPHVVVSRCIEFDHCRWNGMIISSDVIKLLRPHVEFVDVCPEVAIGLGVPRDPIRVIDDDGTERLYQPATDRDVTDLMVDFTDEWLGALDAVDGFILKGRSPSCGITQVRVYKGRTDHTMHGKGTGFFARAVKNRFGALPIEDEGRLTNFRLRHHFLTHLWAGARFREFLKEPSMGGLVAFHAEQKYLLMAYNQEEMRAMGRLVANHAQLPLEAILDEYAVRLHHALSRPASYGSAINVLMHALGYFDVSSSERAYFLQVLDEYRGGQVPLSVPVAIIQVWIARFEEAYLRQQTFFAPYPAALMQISDSGKGRSF